MINDDRLGAPQAVVRFREGTPEAEVRRVFEMLADWGHRAGVEHQIAASQSYLELYIHSGLCLTNADRADLRALLAKAGSEAVEEVVGL